MRDFVMPRVALDDHEEMVLTAWLVDEGGNLTEGVPALEVETSKASMEVEAAQDGVLALRLRQPGDAVSPGDVIALVAERGEAYDAAHLREEHPPPTATAAPAGQQPVEASVIEPSALPGLHAASHVPAAAWQDPPQVSRGFLVGMRPGAAGMRPDTMRASHVEESGPVVISRPVREKLSRHRSAVGRLMTGSAAIPQFSVQLEVDVAAAAKVVSRLRHVGIPLTLTDVFCKAAALTLLRHPAVNSWLVGDILERHPRVSISLATDAPAGVVAPVLHGVEDMDWPQLAAERKRVVEGARAGRLHPDHLGGGTFSISNVGPLGGDVIVPLLVPPQVAILGLGRVRAHADAGTVLTATLVADHRALDGADAVRFLTGFAEVLADADRLVLAHFRAASGT